ncbi:MAG: hypothetical protein FH751_12005 [Firmicutes bacterium]|nr:hypothetical protein [Bacillota bacterium]
MKKKLKDSKYNKRKEYIEVDFHDLMELKEMGLKETEIAREMGIPTSYVNKLMEDMRKDY